MHLLAGDLARLFKDANFDVVEAANGDEALKHLSGDDEIDVVFTDIKLGGEIDGWEFADACRNRWPDYWRGLYV